MRIGLALLTACLLNLEVLAAPAISDAALKEKQPVKDFRLRFHLPFSTLQRMDVQSDLGLSNEQVAALARLLEKHRKTEMRLHPPGGKPRLVGVEAFALRKEVYRIMRECEQETTALLTPAQARRLEQIGLQQLDREMSTFLDQSVVESLRITEAQILKFEALNKECLESWAQLPQDRKKEQEHTDKHQRKKLSILTAEQRQRWKEMLGKPFEGAK
jgi:hypothetical protein